jgi:hypothetical protein
MVTIILHNKCIRVALWFAQCCQLSHLLEHGVVLVYAGIVQPAEEV